MVSPGTRFVAPTTRRFWSPTSVARFASIGEIVIEHVTYVGLFEDVSAVAVNVA